jgi:hypothetical protein
MAALSECPTRMRTRENALCCLSRVKALHIVEDRLVHVARSDHSKEDKAQT